MSAWETSVEAAEACIAELTWADEAQRGCMLEAFARRLELFGDVMRFYPEPFTPVSLTGGNCELSCKHCNKHYLRHMLDASSNLLGIAEQLHSRGGKGIILSGGSTAEGFVLLYHRMGEIRSIRERLPLRINAHTGIIDREQAGQLGFLNTALVDVIADDDSLREVLGVNKSRRDVENTLRYLSEEGVPLASHIIVRIHGGKLKGELRAFEMVRKYHPRVVVIVIFIPTKNTPFEHTSPPAISDVVKIITRTRIMLQSPLSELCSAWRAIPQPA